MRRLAGTVAALLLGLVVVGCFGDIKAPPAPAGSRVPTIVGRVVDWAEPNVSYRLDTGDVVEVGGPMSSASPVPKLLSDSRASVPQGGRESLVLAGVDAEGPFYAATDLEEAGCFRLRGQGYLEPGQVHLSSGLVIPFSSVMTRRNDRSYYDDSWLLAFDHVCVDDSGDVISIVQLPLGV